MSQPSSQQSMEEVAIKESFKKYTRAVSYATQLVLEGSGDILLRNIMR